MTFLTRLPEKTDQPTQKKTEHANEMPVQVHTWAESTHQGKK